MCVCVSNWGTSCILLRDVALKYATKEVTRRRIYHPKSSVDVHPPVTSITDTSCGVHPPVTSITDTSSPYLPQNHQSLWAYTSNLVIANWEITL